MVFPINKSVYCKDPADNTLMHLLKFECGYCKKKFAEVKDMARHELYHDPEKDKERYRMKFNGKYTCNMHRVLWYFDKRNQL